MLGDIADRGNDVAWEYPVVWHGVWENQVVLYTWLMAPGVQGAVDSICNNACCLDHAVVSSKNWLQRNLKDGNPIMRRICK